MKGGEGIHKGQQLKRTVSVMLKIPIASPQGELTVAAKGEFQILKVYFFKSSCGQNFLLNSPVSTLTSDSLTMGSLQLGSLYGGLSRTI